MPLELVATCALGLEPILGRELAALGHAAVAADRGAVTFAGAWRDCWRANLRLRTANRVLVALGRWEAPDGDRLAGGARALVREGVVAWDGVTAAELFDPSRRLAVRATTSASTIRDSQWAALKLKDGLVDGQRDRYGRRAAVDRARPDLALRLWLHRDRATLLLDTSGEPLDHRGYRLATVAAPVREQLAAACVLAADWDGRGPVVDPMCGSGTLLAEAGAIAVGGAPGALRRSWAFARLPGFDAGAFLAVRGEAVPAPGPGVRLYGVDRELAAVAAARRNLAVAGLASRARLAASDAFDFAPPRGPGLVAVNPAYGQRLEAGAEQWRRLGDLLKRRYAGWRAVVLAGDAELGKRIGLRPSRRIPVRNGPLDARILVFALY